MAATFAEFVSLREISSDSFESNHNPADYGNIGGIAYGGCSLAVALAAACKTVKSRYYLYSALGHYLGPALTTDKLVCTVTTLRDTRTFATRQVQVKQRQGERGEFRSVLTLVADFMAAEPASALVYSAHPSMSYTSVDKSMGIVEHREDMVAKGLITRETADLHADRLGLPYKYFETRGCPESVLTQLLDGLAKNLPSSQDHLSLTERASADWLRSPRKLLGDVRNEEDEALQGTALGFIMDIAVSYIPLTHTHQMVDDMAACSSLDFAFRVLKNDFDITDWHLREVRTIAGADGRTYSEGRLWNSEGEMVASMTQQSILRPKSQKSPTSSL